MTRQHSVSVIQNWIILHFSNILVDTSETLGSRNDLTLNSFQKKKKKL